MLIEHLNHAKQRGLSEIRKLFWIFLYLWVLLCMFSVHKSLVLNEQHVFFRLGFAAINALLLAKVMLTGEIFHLADNLKHKPLIYPIVFKSAVFSILLISFYIIEEVLMGLWDGKSVAESIPAIAGGGLRGVLFVGVTMFFVLMPFFALREIGRDMGDDKLYELFFTRRTKWAQVQSQSSQ